jgi:hypothetical protein
VPKPVKAENVAQTVATETIAAVVPSHLAANFRALAESNDRTLSAEMRMAMRAWLASADLDGRAA